MRFAAALLLLSCAAAPAWGAIVSSRPERVTLTIYHVGGPGDRDSGLTEVTEARTLDLPAGESRIRFRGVAATMVPQTAALAGLPGLKQENFDFSLLSPGSLLQKSVGRTVHLVRTDKVHGGETDEAAIVRSGPDGVMLETAAGIEALNCDGLPERLVFGDLPAELLDAPTLSVDAAVPRAGRYRLTLRYLATGLTWAANYVARINPNGRTLTLSGWITLANSSETGFGDTPVQVIAGAPDLTGEDRPPELETVSRQAGCWQTEIDWASQVPSERQRLMGKDGPLMGFATPVPAPPPGIQTVVSAAARVAAPFNLGDYKLYALSEPTTVAAKQTKQIQFLDQRQVPFRRIYRTEGGFEDDDSGERAASVLLRIHNTKAGGVGKPLPAGGIVAFGSEGGASVVMGEKRIKDIAVGLPLDIAGNPYEIGSETMAVSARRVIVKSERRTQAKRHLRRDTIEVTATNHKNAPVDFEWCESASWDGVRLVSAARTPERSDGCWLWPLRLKPGEQRRFSYVLEEG